MLTPSEISALRRQSLISALFSLPVCALLFLASRLYFRYRFKDLAAFRRQVWAELDASPGPVIWAANHLTLIDSFLVFLAIFPWNRVWHWRRIPWSTPEYRNYYQLGGPIQSRAIRILMYLCRCIPFLREGEDEAAVSWRERAFQKCLWILNRGGTVFVYPEAGRSRSGWFESRKPKDFLGRLALAAPSARFLCVYLRGDHQLYTTVAPIKRESYRMHARIVPAVEPGETHPRAVSQRLFNILGELQERWFAQWIGPKNCAGNDLIDLGSPGSREHFPPEREEPDWEWIDRHLTGKESDYLRSQAPESLMKTFWKFFTGKEAAHKALARSGIKTPVGAFKHIEIDLFRRKAVHLPTGCQVDIAFTPEGEDVVHCLAVLRGGYIGDEETAGDVLWKVEPVPDGVSPSEFARERCLRFIADSSDEIDEASLAFSVEEEAPVVLRSGRPQDWGVSLSHSGRYAAFSFMIS
ncbi:MAG: 1-acyl-sn-glycerol-3-phosphate acyltransferase [Elusimicrobia bacterium]|nr:1-acyl-sn-glycerol-3-phosphate acyltransferase [Elusimicrobiota bacterium]